MPCRPQKQPPARTAVCGPAASAAGTSTAGAGIALSIASAATRQAHPHAASIRVAAIVLILLCIASLLGIVRQARGRGCLQGLIRFSEANGFEAGRSAVQAGVNLIELRLSLLLSSC